MHARSEQYIAGLFDIKNGDEFNNLALDIFRYQAANNKIYSSYLESLGVNPVSISLPGQIPFLPISFFKSHKVITGSLPHQAVFMSSGTGGEKSRHFITDIALYEKSFRETFRIFYGSPRQYCILALLPSYLQQENSSLIYMVNDLIRESEDPFSGFYLDDLESLSLRLEEKVASGKKVLLLGVSYALLDLAEKYPMRLANTIIMETGGMKGRRKEMLREELHGILREKFSVPQIHSEYGMTELLSQAYSVGEGIFRCPPWMKVFIRDLYDPFSVMETGKSGAINVTDLANIHSCSFIATQDIGKLHADGSFEVLGRVDHSDLRGCNLMIA